MSASIFSHARRFALGLVLACVALPAAATTVEYIHTDALGSPVAVTDSAGAIIENSEYEPYGKLINRPPTDGPGYTGHVLDAATGLNYMQQRYYDPGIGRFLSVDPVVADGNTGGNFNRYRYANNNPYLLIDPDGRYASKKCPGSTNPFCASSIQVNGTSAGASKSGNQTLLAQALPLRMLPLVLPPPPAPTDGFEPDEDRQITGNEVIARRIQKQIDGIKQRLAGPQAEQYALIAIYTRSYVDVRGNVKDVKSGDVWKYGQTIDPSGRYSAAELRSMGVRYETQFIGNQREVLVVEKIKIFQYYLDHGELPPGNRIFK